MPSSGSIGHGASLLRSLIHSSQDLKQHCTGLQQSLTAFKDPYGVRVFQLQASRLLDGPAACLPQLWGLCLAAAEHGPCAREGHTRECNAARKIVFRFGSGCLLVRERRSGQLRSSKGWRPSSRIIDEERPSAAGSYPLKARGSSYNDSDSDDDQNNGSELTEDMVEQCIYSLGERHAREGTPRRRRAGSEQACSRGQAVRAPKLRFSPAAPGQQADGSPSPGGDHSTYLRFNREPCDKLIAMLKAPQAAFILVWC